MPPFGEQVSGHLLVLSSLDPVSPPFGCILHVVCSITTSSQTLHMMPQLYLPLPPSLLLPFWLFYFFLLRSCTFFFFPALPLLSALVLQGEICPSPARQVQDHRQGTGGFLLQFFFH